MANRKVEGPYQVKNIGANGDVYKVVYMLDEQKNTYQELNPDRTYLKRQSAFRRALNLNKKWNEERVFDDVYSDLEMQEELEYPG